MTCFYSAGFEIWALRIMSVEFLLEFLLECLFPLFLRTLSTSANQDIPEMKLRCGQAYLNLVLTVSTI